jgi:DNA-binding FadR family transcriptional regulator
MARIERRTAVESAIEELRRQILNGTWTLGDRLPSEAEQTQALGISRATLREATRALVHSGLLSVRQGDGTYLVATDESAVALNRRFRKSSTGEVLEVRRGLDAAAVRQAALRRTDDDLAAIRQELDRRHEAAVGGDRAGFATADMRYHLAIARSAHNRLLLDLYETLSLALRDSVDSTQSLDHATHANGDDHAALLDAIEARDPNRAVDLAMAIISSQEKQDDTAR